MCLATYYTTPKDNTISTILHQKWQGHAMPTTPKPPGKSTNAKVHFQAVPDMGSERSIPQHFDAIEPNAHASPATSNQTLGFRNLFRLTPVKVGLKPMTNPLAHCPPSEDITTKSPYTFIPKVNT